MHVLSRVVSLLLIGQTVLVAPQAGQAQSAESPAPPSLAREISWDDLLPPGWVQEPVAIDHFSEPPAKPALSADRAPTVTVLNQERVKLPGYLVPITVEGEQIKEFLMVPYFGACIHVPPPPPNQIVFVRLHDPVVLDDPYGAHWVTGVLATTISTTDLADAAYTMTGEIVERFDWEEAAEGASAVNAAGDSDSDEDSKLEATHRVSGTPIPLQPDR